MLHDLDLSVAAFLGRLLPAGTAVRFDPPDASWAQAPPGPPWLGAFCCDVRQAEPPPADGTLTRDDDGHATGWQPPVRRYRVIYLLTAWADGGPATEHELLGAVLAGCGAVQAIPPDCLHGVLAEPGESVLLTCAATDRVVDIAALWAGLGVPARTALDLTVVAPVVPPLLTELAPAPQSVDVGVRRDPPQPQVTGPALARPKQRITEG